MIRHSGNRMIALAVWVFLAATLAFAAAPAPARRTRGPKRHQATGEVLSVTPTTLELLHARGRGHQRMTFRLTPETKKTVAVAKGKRVTVIYIRGNGQMDAVRIRAPRIEKR